MSSLVERIDNALKRWVMLLLACALLSAPFNAQEAENTAGITDLVSVRVLLGGFGGAYRPHRWLPLQVLVVNRTEAWRGTVTVRPESSGRAISSTYHTPVALPRGGQAVVTLLLQARATSTPLLVEVLNDAGERLASAPLRLTPLDARDKLVVFFGEATAAPPPLENIAPAAAQAWTARLTPDQFPEHAAALEAVDALVIGELFADALNPSQRRALEGWVSAGGHVVWLGSPTLLTQATAWGALLPAQPERVQTHSDWQPLRNALRHQGRVPALARQAAPLLVSAPHASAHVRAVTADGVPLWVRGSYGAGIVDLWAFDPAGAPFATWAGLSALWREAFSSVPLRGSWGRGLIDPEAGVRAIVAQSSEGVFPPVSVLLAVLLTYAGVVGILNYAVLARLKRLEWAWVTTPVLALSFSVLLFQNSVSLQGDHAQLHHLRVVVASAATGAPAQALDLLGVLAPRRSVIALTSTGDALLHPLAPFGESLDRFQSSAQLVQRGTRSSAERVAVEGGIFSPFVAQRSVSHPNLVGQVTLVAREDGTYSVQGALRNASPHALSDITLLARGVTVRLADTLAAGDVLILRGDEVVLANRMGLAAPNRWESSASLLLDARQGTGWDTLLSARGMLNTFDGLARRETLRREALLASVVRDQFGSLARLDDVYAAAWSDAPLDDYRIEGFNTRTQSSTLLLVALATDTPPAPPSVRVTITPEQFFWQVQANDGVRGGINDLLFDPQQSIVLDFLPLPSARLAQVDTLEIAYARGRGYVTAIKLDVWNWQRRAWERQADTLREFVFDDPAPYVGQDGRVRTRWTMDYPTNNARVSDIRISMTGRQDGTPR